MIIRNIWTNKRANVAVISALTMLPIVVAAGGALDLVVTMNRLSEVRQGTHSAVLALANLNTRDTNLTFIGTHNASPENYAKRMMQATVPDVSMLKDLQFEVDFENEIGYKNYTVEASGYIETNFLRLAGVDRIPFEYKATAIQRVQTAEISLALDISSSMSGNRLPQLREASKGFVDLVLGSADPDSTSISVVPFGGTVNIGPDMFNRLAADLDDSDTVLDPDEAEYVTHGNEHDTTKYRFTSDYYCLDFPTEDYEDPDALLTEKSYTQVPSFWKWSDFHNWCPTTGSESVFVSQDSTKLHQVLDRMSLSDGTGTDVGVLWAYKALSPNWQGKFGNEFNERPLAYDTETNLKVMVIMTDGGITFQVRPKDPAILNVHTNRANTYEPLDYDQPLRRGNHGNSQNQRTMYPTGNRNASQDFGYDPNIPQETAVDHFLRVCDHARENNIIVYTISFNLSENHWANLLMQECTSDPSKHYLVNNLDLNAAFDSIAGSISALRMTG